MKTHLRVRGVDCRDIGQTQFEYEHQTACGYVRDKITDDPNKVTCQECLKSDDYNDAVFHSSYY